mgnify:CR=1 FL=1
MQSQPTRGDLSTSSDTSSCAAFSILRAAAAYREALLGYDLALMRAYHTHDEHNKTTILPLLTIAANDGVEEG